MPQDPRDKEHQLSLIETGPDTGTAGDRPDVTIAASGKAAAARQGAELVGRAVELAQGLGITAKTEFRCGRRLWGAVRSIDVVLSRGNLRLGIECKYQSSSGSAEEKLIATIKDIEAWPIPGILVFDGEGFSEKMTAYLFSTGKAVQFEDLENWLKLFFALDDT
jgi:hypothetical protein